MATPKTEGLALVPTPDFSLVTAPKLPELDPFINRELTKLEFWALAIGLSLSMIIIASADWLVQKAFHLLQIN